MRTPSARCLIIPARNLITLWTTQRLAQSQLAFRFDRLSGVKAVGSAVRNSPEYPPLLWTRGIAARETMYYLDRNGFDAEPLLAAAELSRVQLTEDPGGVAVASQHRFLELAAVEAKDPVLGLHVAAEMDLRDIGLLFYLSASSATVAQALAHLSKYARTTNEEICLDITRGKEEVTLTLRPILVLDEPRRQFSELIALAFNRVLCTLTNRDFVPLRITFAHGRNSGLREVHRLLRCPVEFAQPTDSWSLPKRVLELPIVSEDKRLLGILEDHGDKILSERSNAAGYRGLVANRLLHALPGGSVRAAVIGKQLGMSERSLRRYLAQEGTSFGEVLDDLRSRLARRYLQDGSVSLQQIAWLLGYSELAAFNHAFKRWTGTTPGKARVQSARLDPQPKLL